MHIEPGIVDGAKIALSYATAVASFGLVTKMAVDTVRRDGGVFALVTRSVITTLLVFCFFEVLPHYPVGVSEVHLILGSTLYLIFGAGPAAIGLAAGLLLQGLFFAPFDLPQYGINVTTLIVPLWAVGQLAKRIIPSHTAYVDVSYLQALSLSTAYQGGIVAWVAFWAFYGQGFGAENLANVGTFGIAYMSVIILEPLADLAVLAIAKMAAPYTKNPLFYNRLHHMAA
ncbi:MAG: energy-coupling factor ABC transporter permease [Allorhizobium sp.]